MKKEFINGSTKWICKYHPEYSNEKIDEIKYGLESIYLTFIKMFIISLVAIKFNIFWSMVSVLVSINIFRSTACGVHANKSWKCLVITSLILLIPAYFADKVFITPYLKSIVCIFSLISFYYFSPADTEKFPIIKESKRKKLRIKTVFRGIIACFIIIYINNQFISNILLFGITLSALLILPITYFFMDQPYANYKSYMLNISKEDI